MPELTIRKLHPVIGAEVTGIDLRDPVDGETREALSQALSEHLALVFPGQELTPEGYLNAGNAFGPVMRQHYSQKPHARPRVDRPRAAHGGPQGRGRLAH